MCQHDMIRKPRLISREGISWYVCSTVLREPALRIDIHLLPQDNQLEDNAVTQSMEDIQDFPCENQWKCEESALEQRGNKFIG